MYFKQLEMTGFKSFADRTLVRFEPGVTAVVGPNGCGKSNILDAMRWALGEQRAKELRGSQMQDVIFNGSEDRHAMGMAEVAIIFDNSDLKLPLDVAEVEVSRRVYRSGESEYFINKAPCRLRDIHELFMDTGIGTSAYSMIGQGKMDMILSSKPEDRRFLFEEAAGVIKYKTRKRIAMRKLDSAEQNLLRLKDIIAEVERQMRSLKRQVNAAIRYRELSAQLRDIEIRAIWLKYTQLTAEVEELKKRFADATDTYEKLSAETSVLEARYEELGLAKLEVDRVLLARREGVHGIETEMDRLERQIALLKQQVEFSAQQIERAGNEQTQLEQRATAIQDQIQETRDRSSELEADVATRASALDSAQGRHVELQQHVDASDARLETLRGQALERMTHRTRTLTEVEALGNAIDSVDTQLRSIYDKQAQQNSRREVLAVSLSEARLLEAEKQERLNETQTKREHCVQKLGSGVQELRSVEENWATLRESKSRIEARLSSLRELRDAYEGYAVGVRAVMGAKARDIGNLNGIVGPAGDLISTEKKYERAVEAALGGNVNNVIVETADDAKSAIAFLKEHSAGRVTFLPLDLIRGGMGDTGENLRGKPGVIGPAIQFIQFDAPIRNAVEYLLHSTVIVETLDDAIRLARENKHLPRLVTLDGEVLTSAGAVTGGRTKNESRGLIGRSAEISELEEKVTSAGADIETLSAQRKQLQDSIAALTQERSSLERQEVELRNELNAVFVDVARQNTEFENLTLALQNLDAQRNEIDAQRAQIEAQRHGAMERASTLDSDDEVLQREMEQAQETAHRARAEQSGYAQQLADSRVQYAELTQRLEEARRDEQRQLRELEQVQQEHAQRGQLANEIRERSAALEEEIKLTIERSIAFSESKEEARKKVIEAENQRQELLDESDQIEKRLRELREQTKSSQSEVHRVELALRQNEDRIGFFQERVLTEYNLALASLDPEQVGTDELDAETRDKMVTDIRATLQRMGEVNLMAIEEYETLEKRYTFLVTQCADLEKAKETLLGVIAKADKKIRDMFMETFERVAENFRVVFRRLFNGGQARIFLLDENDPLESGIEIEARPPGKKPTSISLLSGGESAMTAIALLFAIFKAKPSPFCVLDEVDAPLDDANIGRFLTMLDEFVSESQFVVITHNKQTMARASALYGVTQQERGVSQLVAVRFDEVKPEVKPPEKAA
jgi:chromosome segregation protein